MDENPKRAISRKGFLQNIVEPGDHTLTINWPLDFEKSYKTGPIFKNLACTSGETLFVSVFEIDKLFRAPKLVAEIETTQAALHTVLQRRLIID